MESVSRILRPIWRLIWIDCIESFETTPTNRNPCDGSNTEKRNSGEDEAVRHPIGLRPGVPAGDGQPSGADLRESLRSEQLWVSQGSQDGRCSEQDLARSGGWKRVDRRRGPERLFGHRFILPPGSGGSVEEFGLPGYRFDT